MSQYIPKSVHVMQMGNDWMVFDQHGPLEGPYASERDAYAVAANIMQDNEPRCDCGHLFEACYHPNCHNGD